MLTKPECILKIQLVKKWAKEHALPLADQVDEEILSDTWLSVCNYSYGNYHIKSIPEEIEVMRKIKRFEFNDVHLKTLPNTLCKITSIEDLYLERNDIETLPPCLGDLKNLAYLDVKKNHISKLPESIGKLQKLIMLNISGNHISNLPVSIGKLKKLERFFLANNPIGRLPEALQECSSLEILDISGTNIAAPPKWLEEMPSLRKVIGAEGVTLHFQKELLKGEYGAMMITFRRLFNQDMQPEEVENKQKGIIGDEAVPLGAFIWHEDGLYLEYYVQWLPHYRGDSHGYIYKDGRHEHLPTLPHIAKVTQAETDLREDLQQKGLLDLW